MNIINGLSSSLRNILRNKTFLVLLCIFAAGAYLRFHNINWDEGNLFHPDEKNLIASSTRISLKDLNPHFFAYGGFSIYLYRLLGEIVALLSGNDSWITDWNKIDLIGRNVSALISSLSIILVFFLSRSVFRDKKAAILAAFFTAFTVYLIQAAHYAVTDTLIIFWLLLVYIVSVRALERDSYKDYERMGMFSGLALATKMSSLSFMIIPVSVHLHHFAKKVKIHYKEFHHKKLSSFESVSRSVFRLVEDQAHLMRYIFFTFIFLFIFSPYSLLDLGHFSEWWDFENGVVSGRLKLEIAYTYQFMNTIPYVFQLENLFWMQGPFLQLFSLLGSQYVLMLAIKKRSFRIFLLLIWPVAYFFIVGGWYAKFVRYIAPLLPFLAIFAAKFLIDLQKRWKRIGSILIFLTMFSVLLYSFAFVSIYKKESTRITASKWIYDNIPNGSQVLIEWGDDQLPISFSGEYPSFFNVEQLNVYGSDGPGKTDYFAEKLSNSDYLVISSKRLYGTFMQLENIFPITARYYNLLFEEKLGYDLVATFSSYPSFLGFEINDDSAEETFQVFDHPKVLIFKKVRNMPPEDYREILNADR